MTTSTLPDAAPQKVFRHEAFFYASEDGFAEDATAFVRGGLDAREPVFVVVGRSKIDRLRGELGGNADRVRFADMAEVGKNPARIIPAWRDFVEEHAGGAGRLRGIGEPIWAGRSADEIVECERHEALLNLAFGGGSGGGAPPLWLICPYDAAALDPAVIEEAKRNHPAVSTHGKVLKSATYRGESAIEEPFDRPLLEPPGLIDRIDFGLESLPELRSVIAERAGTYGLDATRTEDLMVAVGEIAANSVRHGGGRGTLRMWSGEDDLVCEVSDRGRITQPLVGRERPDATQTAGYGLWLANQLADLVQVRTYAAGSVVRLHMHRRS